MKISPRVMGGGKTGEEWGKIRAATASLMSSRDTARSLLMTSQITNCEICRCFGEVWGEGGDSLRFRFQRSDARDSPTGKMSILPHSLLLVILLLFLPLHTHNPHPHPFSVATPTFILFSRIVFSSPLSPQGSAITCVHENGTLLARACATIYSSMRLTCHPKIIV